MYSVFRDLGGGQRNGVPETYGRSFDKLRMMGCWNQYYALCFIMKMGY